MSSVLYTLGFTPKLKAGGPASNSNSISRWLAASMKIKPRWICRLECPKVPCKNDSYWKQNSPAHCIQNSMNLPSRINQIQWYPERKNCQLMQYSGFCIQCVVNLEWKLDLFPFLSGKLWSISLIYRALHSALVNLAWKIIKSSNCNTGEKG